jgi:hypothetical protein
VAPALRASADFAIDKDAGRPCPHLRLDFRCGIHTDLRARGFSGCDVYDCFGAGQKVSQAGPPGRNWRTDPGTATHMFAVFGVVRQVHELLWYLAEALTLPAVLSPESQPLEEELRAALDRIEGLTEGDPTALQELDVDGHRARVGVLLGRVSELTRTAALGRAPGRGPGRGKDRAGSDLRGADFIGKDLAGADLRGASLRGAHVIGADVRWADLRTTDLLGADLRGARLDGADLSGALFLTRSQVRSAIGDAATRLPGWAERPAHWSS